MQLETALDMRSGEVVKRAVNGTDYAQKYLDAPPGDFETRPEPVERIQTVAFSNAGFELGRSNWSWKYDYNDMFSVCPEAACQGDRGLRLLDSSETETGGVMSDVKPCVPGTHYELRFRYRVAQNNQARSGPTVAVEFLNESGPVAISKMSHPEYYHVVLAPTGTWCQESIRVTALEGCPRMRVKVYSSREGVCQADFDDFEFTEINVQ